MQLALFIYSKFIFTFLTFSTDLSGLDLPDLTIGTVASTAKGLRRKRPRRSLNVTAFEKRLKDGDGNIMDFTCSLQ